MKIINIDDKYVYLMDFGEETRIDKKVLNDTINNKHWTIKQ